MPHLILIRHAAPEIIQNTPASHWRLSAVGREQCIQLAGQLASYQPEIFIASLEAKASETAAILAAQIGVPWKVAQGLHEHERRKVPFTTLEEFQNSVAELFRRQDEPVFGDETARQAQARFSEAVRSCLTHHKEQNIAIVSHGTVITLWLAQHFEFDPFKFWQVMPIPAWFVLRHPEISWIAPRHHPGEIAQSCD